MASAPVELISLTRTNSVLDSDDLSLSTSGKQNLKDAANGVNCAEIIQQGKRGESLRIKKLFTPTDPGIDLDRCKGCIALQGRIGGCSKYLQAEADSSVRITVYRARGTNPRV